MPDEMKSAATCRDCSECGKHNEHLMMDGEWICHSCGHVEFPPGRDPAAPWREHPAAQDQDDADVRMPDGSYVTYADATADEQRNESSAASPSLWRPSC